MTNEPIDEFTEDVTRQIVAVKNDPIVRRKYMVLQAELRDTEIIAFEAGEAKGHAAGLAEGLAAGLAEGEAKKSRETALKMLRKQKPLSEIMEFASMTEEDIVSLAKENGLEVVRG